MFLMNNMTAKSKWLPYQQLMISGELNHCIDFDEIKIQYPFGFSIVTGLYQKVKFQFSDVTLKALIYELTAWVRKATENEIQSMKQRKLQFSVSVSGLKNVSK